ncbi:MAG: hypothetical protein RL141_480 [Candidatus Parcubacteria bacterium]|jgi:cysteinyl-tRNA synthetase
MKDILFYNSLGRRKSVFQPITQGHAGIYTCGLTVYERGHIGNFRAFIIADVLHRILVMNGYRVTHVINITDVGHLVGDGSDGEDKMEVSSKKYAKSSWEIVEKYTNYFLEDLRHLNILPPTFMPKATDHILEQIALIQRLETKGHTYRTRDGIYFATKTLPNYGRLSGQRIDEKAVGVRVDIGEKRHPADFALWKFSPQEIRRQMEWPSPWGVGFPGWHIECSAMSQKYLGLPFDIHTGGVDHVAVHHENEIAQVEGAYGILEANVWLHNEFLLVDGGKMSKSLGNTYSLDDIVGKNVSPLAFRYFILGAGYRVPQNFTWQGLDGAQRALNRLENIVRTWRQPTNVHKDIQERFLEKINDDLDTPGALALLWATVTDDAIPEGMRAATVIWMDDVLGLSLRDIVGKPLIIPTDIQVLLAEREQARKEKKWDISDEIRQKILDSGFLVDDTETGQVVREKRSSLEQA